MEFTITRNALNKELGFVQGVVEKKNTIPALSNILIESVGENAIRVTGTDLDVTIRCEAEAEIKTPGAMCVQAKKLFEISRLLPDAPVHFRKDENDWANVKCERSNFRIVGVSKESFPEVPNFKSTPVKFPAETLKTFIDRTIFAITLEESRYTLSGAKFVLDSTSAKMVTTDGHRLAFIEKRLENGNGDNTAAIDILIPRKTLSELVKLTSGYEGEVGFGADDNHIYFEVASRLLISRTLAGQFPNYEMVLPKNNDKSAEFKTSELSQAMKRVATMADDRSRAVKLSLLQNNLQISSQTAEEGEATESLATDYQGDAVEIGFNAQYVQDFLNVVSNEKIAFDFKDSNSQALLRPVEQSEYDYRYVVMPMRV